MPRPPVLYQETRLSTTPASSSSILRIDTSGHKSGAVVPFGAGRKRPFDEISGLDEETYARKHLATEGSVFFRPKNKAPRNFLWRVLNDRTLLEVQCVDLVLNQQHSKAESWLTFHITFSAPIVPSGIAFADGAERDALDVFVLTSAHELHTITLKRDLLVRETPPVDFDSSTCFKKFASSSFTYKHPYRLVAFSSLELCVSFHDGSMLRLEREQNTSGAHWRETHFSEGGWSGTLKRSLIPFAKPQTARYGDIELHADAVAAIAKSPDGQHIWTVGLDHRLKAWNTRSGKVETTTDLLEDGLKEEDSKKHSTYLMNAEQGTLLQVVQRRSSTGKEVAIKGGKSESYVLVVHSPKDHQFKFYNAKPQNSSLEGVPPQLDDAAPGVQLIPPIDALMDTNMWHLEHFAVNPGPDWRRSQLWLKARSGSVSRTFLLIFDLMNDRGADYDIEALFKNGWTEIGDSYLSVDSLRASLDFDALDQDFHMEVTTSERWLKYLFYPGRFSNASLEAALHIYRKGRNLPTATDRRLHATEEPLKERITSAVSANILLRRPTNEQPAYDQYQADLHAQWTTFCSLLSHLHSRRHESVGFAFDHETELAWSVCADFVAPIRASSSFEVLHANADLLISGDVSSASHSIQRKVFPDEEAIKTGQILAVARQLRQCFSSSSQAKLCDLAVVNALDQSGDHSGEQGLLSIYDQCRFQDEVRDRDFDALTEAADEFNGLGSLTVDDILMVLERVEDPQDLDKPELREHAVHFGERLGIAMAQETVQLTQATLLDVLALIVFMHGDLEPDELSPDFHPVEVYEAIILRLRCTELRRWLVSNTSLAPGKQKGQPGVVRTLYQSLFWHDWVAERDRVHTDMPHLLTTWNKAWAFGLSLNQQWSGIAAHILAELLKHEQVELALDFVKFLPEEPWISYLKGRLHVAAGDFARAGLDFKDAAEECATTGASQDALLSPEDLNYFSTGKGRYYQHVAGLFEKLQEYSWTADFLFLALENFLSDDKLQAAFDKIDERKGSKDSPAKTKLAYAADELRLMRERQDKEDVRTRLFNALVQTGRFEQAYDTLKDIDNPALQRSNLQTLLQTCVKRDAIATLLALPMTGDFAQEADSILLSLAKKSMTSGLPSGPPYHQILFAFRTGHSNFRGAAAILHEHLEHLQKKHRATVLQDPEDETLLQIYVLLINTLACCGEDGGAWLLADPIPGLHDVHRKRRLVTLQDIRRDYTAELDRRSEILLGRFPVVGKADDDDEMDIF